MEKSPDDFLLFKEFNSTQENVVALSDSYVSFFLDGVESEEFLGSLILEPDSIYYDQTIIWQFNSYVIVDLDVFWDVGSGILKWYRVQGACAPCSFNSNCQSTGLQVLGPRCIGGTTGQQFYIQNVLARNIKEVCNILQESKLNWEVCTIKVYSRPADPSLSGPEDNCNTLIDVPFESVPECINVYVQEKTFIKIKMKAVAITANFDIVSPLEGMTTGGSAEITGDTGFLSYFDYISSGEPVLIINGETESIFSLQNDPIIQTKMVVSMPYLEVVLSSKDNNAALSGALSNIRTVCGNCTSMPSIFYIYHNFADTPEVKNFLNKNTSKLPDNFFMRYNRKFGAWSANYQMSGEGSYGLEKWTFSFNWSCMKKSGDDYSSPYWKFSAFINKLYIDKNLDFDTKINIIFPPDYLCNQINGFNFDLIFNLNTISKYVSNNLINASVTEDVIISDNIGLFKSDTWKSSPLLKIKLSNNLIIPLLDNTDLTPIIPVAVA